MVENSETFSTYSKSIYYKTLQLHVPNNIFFLKFGIGTRNGSFGLLLE